MNNIDNFKLQDFKNIIYTRAINEPYLEDYLDVIQDMVEEDKIIVFYPKHIKDPNLKDNLIIYVFEKDHLKIINYFKESKKIKIEILKYNLVKKIIICHKKGASASLEIDFGGEIINFDSETDFGPNNYLSSITKILEIYNLLV